MHFASETSKYASICSLDAKYSFLFVSLLFFTQKYLTLNPLMEHLVPLTNEQWALIKPLFPPTKSANALQRCLSMFQLLVNRKLQLVG